MHRKALVILSLFVLESATSSLRQSCEFLQMLASAPECKAVIQMDNSIFSKQARAIGFNYELLNSFAENNRVDIPVGYTDKGCTAWKELSEGRCNIVIAKRKDSIPDDYKETLLASVPINGDFVWIVRRDERKLLNNINLFLCTMQGSREYKVMAYRHFRSYKTSTDAISPYDNIIKKYSRNLGIDWRLLAAIIFTESRYNQATTSHRNAKGLMQIRKVTADKYGITDIYNPDANIKAGTLMLQEIIKHLTKEGGLDEDNLIKFTLASYNAGEARISRARTIAFENGLDHNDWDEVTTVFSQMPDFSGKQTVKYIDDVLEKWEEYIEVTDTAAR